MKIILLLYQIKEVIVKILYTLMIHLKIQDIELIVYFAFQLFQMKYLNIIQ